MHNVDNLKIHKIDNSRILQIQAKIVAAYGLRKTIISNKIMSPWSFPKYCILIIQGQTCNLESSSDLNLELQFDNKQEKPSTHRHERND